jgi:hypothetical protein
VTTHPVYVVRGGRASPQNLIDGTAEHADVSGLSGFSVQSAPDRSVEELAIAGRFPNAVISVTTVEALAQRGVRVVPSPGAGFHATAVVPIPLDMTEATEISRLFKRLRDPFRLGGR